MWPFWGHALLEGWGSGGPSSGAPSAGGASRALCQSGNQVSSQTLSTVWACQEGGVRNLSAWLMEGGRWYLGSIWQPLCTLSLKKNKWKTMTFTLECLFFAALPDLLPNLPWNSGQVYPVWHSYSGGGKKTSLPLLAFSFLSSLSFLPPPLPMIPFDVCMCVYIYI